MRPLKPIHEIRWHGRAGQGVITASRLLAQAALDEGKFVQAFPEFGAERLGAPVSGFTRISEQPVDIRSQIYSPEAVVVLDPRLLRSVNVSEGLIPGGYMVVNSEEEPGDLKAKLKLKDANVYTVDVSRIASEVFGRAIYNTPMLGALLRVLPIVSFDSVEKVTLERFPGSMGKMNVDAMRKAYEEVVGPR
ncbi:MAG: 2-oxoacid:acceptor oxidoreductase family protein [Candidatus Bathyarchaeia archaeon]